MRNVLVGLSMLAGLASQSLMSLALISLALISLALISPALADVQIGILMPKTGFGAGFGAEEQGSIDLFMSKYADLGPAGKLKLTIYDTRGEPAQAISLTRKLIDTDNVLAILGPYFSGESEAAFPVANRAATPIVTPSSAKPGIAAANRPWTFRNASTTDKTDAALVVHWLKRQSSPVRKVVIFYDGKDAVSSSDGKAVMPAVLKANNIEVLDSISFQTGDVDFSAQVTRAKALGADGIVMTALFTEAGHLTRELRRQGMQQPILAGVELSLDHKFIETAGDAAAEGVLTGADFNRDSPRPSVVAFIKEYQERVGQLPGNSSALMYDALFLMRHCIMTTGVAGSSAADKAKIRDCWAGLKDVDAPIAGPSSIDENGDARHAPNFLIVKSGKFVVDR
ncbi:ABC transporter substrate-binding protein [Roseiarcaceae bacterium H3SJ34-1]|uniref:ABC transporter substrate-binding protein n=1 Tax=Terripilifer ovatus TaxID=3032367 RepID=UPI003AB9A16A|nr:ABC transporter substrate-binding protein [Roseiarcaceae bacterium H3SJ34-1]